MSYLIPAAAAAYSWLSNNNQFQPGSTLRKVAGQTVENIGDRLGIPETQGFSKYGGISETIAGGNTLRTNQTQAYNPVSAPGLMPNASYDKTTSGGFEGPDILKTSGGSGGNGSGGGGSTTRSTSSFSSGDPQRDAFNSVLAAGGYAGWNINSAWEDFKATGGPRIGSSSGDDARKRYEDELRSTISSGYDQYEDRLRGMEGYFNQRQSEDLGLTESNYGRIFGGLTDQKANTLQKIEGNRGQVRTMASDSIKDLQRNFADTVRGTSMLIGAMGAGDTSAAQVMMPYAYTKLAGTQEAGIQRQKNDQLFQLQQDELDTENQFNTLWTQVETEKANSIQAIRDTYGDRIAQVRNAMANAPVERAQAMAGLVQNLLSEAQARLGQIEAEDRQYKKQIQDWATGRMAELNNMKLEIANNANFNPQDIVFNELQVANAMGGPTTNQGVDLNPLILAQRRREQLLKS